MTGLWHLDGREKSIHALLTDLGIFHYPAVNAGNTGRHSLVGVKGWLGDFTAHQASAILDDNAGDQ